MEEQGPPRQTSSAVPHPEARTIGRALFKYCAARTDAE